MMGKYIKIDFKARKIREIADVTDIVAILFPGNRNMQYAAGRLLIELKEADKLVENFSHFEDKYSISRRTIQRARAKLASLGLIEYISWMNKRYHGQIGWKLSQKFSSSLRYLDNQIEQWLHKKDKLSLDKEKMLLSLI